MDSLVVFSVKRLSYSCFLQRRRRLLRRFSLKPLLICSSKLIHKDWMFTWEASAVLIVTDNADWLAYHSSSFQLLWLRLEKLRELKCGVFWRTHWSPINKLLLTQSYADMLTFTSFRLSFSKSSGGGRGLWNDNALGTHRGSGMLCFRSGMCWRMAEVQKADPLFLSISGFWSFPHSVSNCLPVCRVLVLIAVCHAIRHSVMFWLCMVLAFFLLLSFSVFALLLNQLAYTWRFCSYVSFSSSLSRDSLIHYKDEGSQKRVQVIVKS